MIEQAIAQGAPLFNAGHPGECAAVYQQAMTRLMSGDCGTMPASLQTMMSTTLGNASRMHSHNDRAWALRRGLETVYANLSTMPTTIGGSACGN